MLADFGTVDRDGFMLEWVREGHGLPVMVLGVSSFYRRYFPQSLREHFEIVFCDLRPSAPTPDGFDITAITRDTFSDDVEAVRRAVGFERPVVAGQSVHGAIALEYARRYPDSVRGVAAVAAVPPAGSGEGLESAEDFFQRDASRERLAAHARNKAERRVPATVETAQDFIDLYVSDDAMGWYDFTFDCSPLWEGIDVNLPLIDRLYGPEGFGGYQVDALDVPVFLALGRYDYLVPFYLWDQPKTLLSSLRYRLYDKSGHHPPYEQPDEFAADLVEWARSL
jgi:pimeloyl-ACP methyl ester carboxylesterase